MTDSTEVAWVVIIPVKRAHVAKSRLAGVTLEQRVELARAFPADCAAASLAATAVEAVVAVTDDEAAAGLLRELGAEVIADEPDAGLNPALRHAHEHVRQRYPGRCAAVLSGDLPALRAGELDVALRRARPLERAFVPDLAGAGTTLLTAGPSVDLDPRFGAESRRHHRDSGAVELEAADLPSVRHDVDTWADLQSAVGLGVGPHTRGVLLRYAIDPLPLD